jgi:hypothetical protein
VHCGRCGPAQTSAAMPRRPSHLSEWQCPGGERYQSGGSEATGSARGRLTSMTAVGRPGRSARLDASVDLGQLARSDERRGGTSQRFAAAAAGGRCRWCGPRHASTDGSRSAPKWERPRRATSCGHMNRRHPLRRAAAAVAALPGMWARMLGPRRAVAAVRTMSRVRPADSAWPSEASWDRLGRAVEGRLVRVRSPLDGCLAAPSSPACAQVFKNARNPYHLGDEVGLTQCLGWRAPGRRG